jgi:ABC-type nitrate/sulfonate/bicarbonate transport system ATPase subunit
MLAAPAPPSPTLPHPRQVIKRFIMHSKKTAFIVEHDFIMATYMADRVVVYDGQPSREAWARTPQSLLTGGHSMPGANCTRAVGWRDLKQHLH